MIFQSVYIFREQKRETSTMTVSNAGLVHLNIKSNSGSGSLRTSAATRLATTTRTSVPGFGVMAKRSPAGTGSIFNAKAYNSLSHSMLRHDLNDNRLKWTNNLGGEFYTRMPDMGINKSNKFAEALTAIATLATLTGTAVNAVAAVKAASAADASGSVSKSDTTNSSSMPSLNDMKNAKDSTTLRGAIETAEADKTKMQSELSELEGKLPSMKEASEAATEQLEELKPQVEAKCF